MIADRRRAAAVVAAFALVLILGVTWLVRTAMADPATRTSAGAGVETPASSDTDADNDAGTGTEADPGGGGAQPPTGADPDDGAGPGPAGGGPAGPVNSELPPPPARTVRVNGPLGGGPMDDSCLFFVNPFEVALTVRSVALTSADDGMSLDDAHCPASLYKSVDPNLQACRPGAVLAVKGACYTGAELAADKRVPPGSGEPVREYTALARLGFTATCTSADVTPCSQEAVAKRSPSASNPVKIEWRVTSDDPFRRQGKADRSPEPEPSESSSEPAPLSS